MKKVATAGLVMALMIAATSRLVAQEAHGETPWASPEQAAYLQQHKQFIFLRTKVADGKVVLTFLRGPWYSDKDQPLFEHVCIYRRQVDFVYGKDRDEFFQDVIPTGDDLIHDGPVPVSHGRSFRWVDGKVTVGQTYAYWVGVAGGQPNGPVGVKVRDPRVWWSDTRIAAETHKLQEDFPDLVTVEVPGRTIQGRQVLGITVGKSDKRVALIGAVHASEAGPELILYTLRDLLTHHREIFDDVSIAAIPVVNGDERQHAVEGVPWYLRRNLISVDLNRNFPGDWDQISYMYGNSSADPDSGTYRGPFPASEPETQAVMAFLQAHPPTVVLSYHHLCSVTGRCFWAPQSGQKDEPFMQRCRQAYEAYGRGYVRPSDPKDDKDYLLTRSTAGSLPTWVYRQFDAPGFDVEKQDDGTTWPSETDQVTPEFLLDNQQRHAAAVLSLMQSLR